MLKLFIRFYLLMLILLALSLISLNLFFTDIPIINNLLINAQAEGEEGPIFNYIKAQLSQVPQSQWNQTLENITPQQPHHPIAIVPLNEINLSNTRQQKLLIEGRIVGTTTFFHAPMNDTTDSYKATVYQRIPNSDLALDMQVMQKQRDTVFGDQIWLIHFINLEFSKHPQQSPAQVLQEFSQIYHLPVQFVALNSLTIEMQNYLLENQFLMDSSNDFNIYLCSYYLYNQDTVLKLGPFHYPWYMMQLGSMVLGSLVIFIALFMLFSLYSFYRDLKKLDRLAQEYGEGHFDYKIKIGRFAAMSSLYRNLKTMGNHIQKLLISHKELTQAVSHELKTPLARLKFALRMIEDAKKKDELHTYVISANEAVIDLEELVSELLLYTRFDRQLFQPKQESLPVANTLLALLIEAEEKNTNKTLRWNIAPETQGIHINITPQYFEKIMANLLSNAYRYAKSRIELSLYLNKDQVLLTIEDDGPGIPEVYRQKIFEPFFSLDESRNKELSGHGLGLSIVERLANAHGGTISVTHSEALGGAAFTLSFPRID